MSPTLEEKYFNQVHCHDAPRLFSGGKPLMVRHPIHCPSCQSTDVVKHGKTADSKQRFFCQNAACPRQTFLIKYVYKGLLQEVKQQIVEMAMNGSGIRDTARVLHVSPTTVIETLKKRAGHPIHQSGDLGKGTPGDHAGGHQEG